MNKGVTLIGGLGLGAALMYLFDPDRGKRRRSLLKNKVESAGNKAIDSAEKMGRNLRNRAYGVVAETKSIFRQEDISDDVLIDRVRSRLGRMPVDISTFEVNAQDVVVMLRGNIFRDELPKVLRAVRFVRGVKDLDDQFTVQDRPGGVADLQGEPRPIGAG